MEDQDWIAGPWIAGAPENFIGNNRTGSCLIQRAFKTNFRLNCNSLLAGGSPFDGIPTGPQDDLHPGGVPSTYEPHQPHKGLLAKFLLLSNSQQALIACSSVLIFSLFLYLIFGQASGQSVDTHRVTRIKRFRLYYHVVVLCFSGFLRGYGLYLIGPFLTPVQRALELCFPCPDGTTDLALASCTCAAKEFAVSSVALGAIFGGVIGGCMADAVGRRPTLLATDMLFIMSSLTMGMAGPGKWTGLFFVGRVMAGMAIGASGPASHAYLSEIVPAKFRGQLLTLGELALNLGCLTVFGFSGALGDKRWRRAVEFSALPALLQLVCTVWCLYESPRWLASVGKIEKANVVIEALGLESFLSEEAHDSTIEDAECLRHVSQNMGLQKKKSMVEHSISTPRVADKTERSWYALLVHHRRRVLLALGCALAHNALGANIVMYYSRDVLQLAGVSNSVLSQLGLGIAKVIGMGVTFATVDRVGRRLLLILGVVGALLGHLGLAAAFSPWNFAPFPMLAWVSLLLFLAAWDMSWASLMSVVISEVLPDDVRGLGLGASCSLYWVVSFLQAQTLETLFKSITIGGTFGMYFVASVFGLLFVLLYVPETCGRPLEVD